MQLVFEIYFESLTNFLLCIYITIYCIFSVIYCVTVCNFVRIMVRSVIWKALKAIIYIVIHRQTVSLYHNSSVWLDTEVIRFKVGSKPAKLYIRFSILRLIQQATYVSSGIITHYVLTFVCLYFALPDTGVFNSLEELIITRLIPLPQCSLPA